MMKFICTFVFVLTCLHVLKAEEDCSKLGIHFYDDIGCPKKANGTGCPTYEDCKYERAVGGCLFRGQKYLDGQGLSNGPTCNFCGCSASELDIKGSFVCAIGGCSNWGRRLPPGCYFKHSLNRCCTNEIACESAQPIPTCTIDGKVYREGEIYNPKGTCLKCRCNGDDKKDCVNIPCSLEIKEAQNLERNCALVYYLRKGKTALCCPSTIVCPSKDDVVIEDKLIPGGKTCKYGDQVFKQGKKIQRIIQETTRNRTATCECLSPPWLTCTAEF